uniref:Uncharacterized protein n=1 Tax=Corethron hystrix TaxID=216773 RepID=A0A7S1B9Z9_9STRA|mmetsp:Transcript_18854/g.42993  ORF Transcript_18854/g.42993 Transcript_18854/m.42993 type:complete len:230 (+) Transcript_18854:64-753(+)
MLTSLGKSMAPTFSDYEHQRATNIERNNARLRLLGLITPEEESISNDLAWGKSVTKSLVSQRKLDDTNSKKATPRKRKKGETIEETAPTRKSRRLQGISASKSDSNEEMQVCDHYTPLPHRQLQTREEQSAERRKARLRAAALVAEAGADAAAMENPTASYEHCLMRVRTMTEKGLGNRIKAIERAAGRHCVVKMAIFRSCLLDEGYDELAEDAGSALERLKGLLPVPE